MILRPKERLRMARNEKGKIISVNSRYAEKFFGKDEVEKI